jgi:hypothetical protein
MPQYFFHLRDGANTLFDPDGRDLMDLQAVAAQALREARSLISHDALTGHIDLQPRIEVEDAAGHVVHRLSLRHAITIAD